MSTKTPMAVVMTALGEARSELSRVTEERDKALRRIKERGDEIERLRGEKCAAQGEAERERQARLKMHDEMERQAQLATEARMDRDAALRRVREIEVSALATLKAWDALRSAHDGRDESERRAFADSIAALEARLDAAEQGEKE